MQDEFKRLLEATNGRVIDLKRVLKAKGYGKELPEDRDICSGSKRKRLDEASCWIEDLLGTLRAEYGEDFKRKDHEHIELATATKDKLDSALRALEFPDWER